MNEERVMEFWSWNFPGGGWTLAALALMLILLVGLSYAFPRHRITRGKKILLASLRILFFAGVLFCAMDLRRVEERTFEKEVKRKLYLVFDTSSSMTIPGLSGPSRLESALEALRGRLPEETGMIWGFDERQTEYPSLKALLSAASAPGTRETDLSCLQGILRTIASRDEAAGVLIFTDGIETVHAAAQAPDIPSGLTATLIGCDTELPQKQVVEFLKIESPSQLPLNALASVNVLGVYSNLAPSDELRVLLFASTDSGLGKEKDGDSREENRKEMEEPAGNASPDFQVIAEERIARTGIGGNVIFRATLPPRQALGQSHYRLEMRLNGKVADSAEWTVATVERKKKKVLIYQNTYDWAARFFRDALSRSEQSRIDVEIRNSGARRNPGTFPDKKEIWDFDAVILLNIEYGKCPEWMFDTLDEYVRNSGGVLFVTGNPRAASGFAGTRLETFLPVEFEPVQDSSSERVDRITREFRSAISVYRNNPKGSLEQSFVNRKNGTYQPRPMYRMLPSQAGREGGIFRRADGTLFQPLFLDYAPVRQLKPGASELASFTAPGGRKSILLATQRYGAGRSAVLATDPLWHWRLSMPSDNRDFSIFWENLTGFLAQSGRGGSDGWMMNDMLCNTGTPLKLLFLCDKKAASPLFSVRALSSTSSPASSLSVPGFSCSASPDPASLSGKAHGIPLELHPDKSHTRYEGVLTLENPGVYQLDSVNASGLRTSQIFTVRTRSLNRETELLALNRDFFRTDPECSPLLDSWMLSDLKAGRKTLNLNPDGFRERSVQFRETFSRPFWWRWQVLAALLGILALEWLLRRRWSLV